MTAKVKTLLAGHRVSVRAGMASKWVQDATIDLAPGDSLTVNGTVVVPPVTPPPVTPPPTGNLVAFHGGTPAQLNSLGKVLDTSVIEMGGLFSNWNYLPSIDIDRPADRPLIIRPAAGEVVTFDGGNGSSPAFQFGWNTPLKYVTFQGPFNFQRYRLSLSGLVMARRYDHAAFHRAIVRDVMGVGSAGTVHALYLLATTTGGYPSQYWASDDWDVLGPATRILNGVHIYDASSHSHIATRRWLVESVNRAVYGWSGKDVLIDGFTGKNVNGGIDAEGGDCEGVVTNCHFTNAGALRSHWPLASTLRDGGGNTSA